MLGKPKACLYLELCSTWTLRTTFGILNGIMED